MDNLVGPILKEIRERSGLSLRSVARELGWGHRYTTYRAYEDNQKNKSLSVHLVKKLIPIFEGRGTPRITKEELWQLTGITKSDMQAIQCDAEGRNILHLPREKVLLAIEMQIDAADCGDADKKILKKYLSQISDEMLQNLVLGFLQKGLQAEGFTRYLRSVFEIRDESGFQSGI